MTSCLALMRKSIGLIVVAVVMFVATIGILWWSTIDCDRSPINPFYSSGDQEQ